MVNQSFYIDPISLPLIERMNFPYMLLYNNPENPRNDEIFQILNAKLAINSAVLCYHVSWELFARMNNYIDPNQSNRIMSYRGNILIAFSCDVNSPEIDEMIENIRIDCNGRYRHQYLRAREFLNADYVQNNAGRSVRNEDRYNDLLIPYRVPLVSSTKPGDLPIKYSKYTQTPANFLPNLPSLSALKSYAHNRKIFSKKYIKMHQKVKASNLLKTSSLNLRKPYIQKMSNIDINKRRKTNFKYIDTCSDLTVRTNLHIQDHTIPKKIKTQSNFRNSGLIRQISIPQNQFPQPKVLKVCTSDNDENKEVKKEEKVTDINEK